MSENNRLIPLTVMLLLTATGAFCGPRISIGDPPPGTPVGLDFTFSTDAHGGGFFSFTNQSDVKWTTLDFDIAEPTGTSVTCVPGDIFFDFCDTTALSSSRGTSILDIGFEDRSGRLGIAPGDSFTVNLNSLIDGQPNTDPNGTGQWCPETTFQVFANQPAPEPASAGLILAAALLTGLFAARRRLASRPAGKEPVS